jgi:uncharacterized protein (DUF1697 family)
MGTYVAMLRSINVGGRNRIPMADLRALVSSLGFGDVVTYIQSGNVVLTGSGTATAVARAIEDRITADLGLSVPVLARSKQQLRRIMADSPYRQSDVEPKTIHVTFLADRPDPARVGALEGMAGTFGSDTFEVIGSEVHLHCPGGYGETTLNNAYLERRLGVVATTRNWRTVATLGEMAGL